ncbi:hypothetical protein Mapa_015590 [Marchantia paleacea]|nr:hypothetical protein Mapa_015590 [Marchantia paleacea]
MAKQRTRMTGIHLWYIVETYCYSQAHTYTHALQISDHIRDSSSIRFPNQSDILKLVYMCNTST